MNSLKKAYIVPKACFVQLVKNTAFQSIVTDNIRNKAIG